MIDLTRTTTELLDGLAGDQRPEVWEEFDLRYRPILINVARRMGLREEDARDVAQETLMRFVVAFREGEYDRERGRLRAWLLGIARYRILEARRARAKEDRNRGDSVVESMADENELDSAWEIERRDHLLRLAYERLRTKTRLNDQTVKAFEMLTLQQNAPAEVAEAMGISTHDVYLAKSRCLKKFREILAELESSYEEGGS